MLGYHERSSFGWTQLIAIVYPCLLVPFYGDLIKWDNDQKLTVITVTPDNDERDHHPI